MMNIRVLYDPVILYDCSSYAVAKLFEAPELCMV
jgi:hypothetical protein